MRRILMTLAIGTALMAATFAVAARAIVDGKLQVEPAADNRYIVVEIGVFPAKDAISLAPNDFMLRVPGTNQVLRPVSPETIATGRLKIEATAPASTSPSEGPLATTASSMPLILPRISSGATVWRIVLR